MDTNKKHLVGDNKQLYLNVSKGFELGFCSSSSFFFLLLYSLTLVHFKLL